MCLVMLVLAEEVRALPAVVTETSGAAGPVRCEQVCRRLEPGTEPTDVETTRAKLNRLAGRGWLRRNGAEMFAILPRAAAF